MRNSRHELVFGLGLSSAVATTAEMLRQADRADADGLDMVSVSDHPYYADRLDAYATVGVLLGRTERLAAFANVTSLPVRPAPMLARTITSLSELSEGRVILGLGAGGLWDEAARLGVPRLTPGEAVRAFEEAFQVVRALSGGGGTVTFDGEFYQVKGLDAAAAPTPPIWTGSNGPRSLAVTGRQADGWIPGHAADWLSERYRWSRPIIDEAAAAAGRDPSDIRTIYNLPGRITDRPLTATRDAEGRWLGGSPAQWTEELTGAVLDHGATGFTYFGDQPDAWAREVAPAIREAVAAAHPTKN
ncbi:LLM class flavin-dependent oxidoreductase [Actinomadura rupiterrae]|uniref:LLM class flavin-dependent oxidoreductase n=1 Tax=Actinomadura rupiterrae TaxID=559627 RepID=UPI0020A32FD1|nr:LLM class flavin-dependent oxidoreductase [Actinomadura rupiterrae]MCP2339918.1 alkanesulfonate monooxygenase SsuD/methylene tetrahydromethanopterin reductase-like flavin-dependent oxidoreductase (luciferase family) [Actinomadura rupiterrae]